MKMSTRQLGTTAEDWAVKHLTKQGFAIVARNYRYQRAEVDIIAQKDRLLVFVEVKARSDNQFGDPETFVSSKQQALVHTAAEYYITAQDWNHAIRFDIIAVHSRNHCLQLTHFEDAF